MQRAGRLDEALGTREVDQFLGDRHRQAEHSA